MFLFCLYSAIESEPMSWKRTLTFRARKLRKNSTKAEKRLWMLLRRKALQGIKFYRQYPIGYYIVDFYCPKHNLVIEIDGGIHNNQEQQEYDQERQNHLEGTGLSVLRFSNEEVLTQIHRVAQCILHACNTE